MHAASGPVGKRLAEECEVEATLERLLAGEYPEQESVVGSFEGVVVFEGHLELRLVEFGVDRFDG